MYISIIFLLLVIIFLIIRNEFRRRKEEKANNKKKKRRSSYNYSKPYVIGGDPKDNSDYSKVVRQAVASLEPKKPDETRGLKDKLAMVIGSRQEEPGYSFEDLDVSQPRKS